MTFVEALLVAGTYGICLGVWITLWVIIRQESNKKKMSR